MREKPQWPYDNRRRSSSSNVGGVLWVVLFILVMLGSCAHWVSVHDECDEKNGVVLRNAWGYPTCVSQEDFKEND
jgi:hypothetical protein